MNYIGIDLGTSSVKGLLMSTSLEVLCSFSADYPNNVDSRGWSDQNPADWREQTLAVLKQLISSSEEQIGAISFSGQMHGLVTLDQEDNVIRPAILWNDQRTVAECEYLNNQIGTKFLIENTGNIALTGYTAPKVLWMKNNEPELFERISKVMLPKDYIAYLLSGQFATDYSDASGTLYLDVEHRCWSKPMLDILGLSEDNLPKLYNSYDVIGSLTTEMKSELGIDYDIEIVIGGGDQAVGSVGTGTVEPGDINISLGTSGVVFAATESYSTDDQGTLHSFCDATGKFHKMGVALNSGGSMQWWSSQIICDDDFAKLENDMRNVDPAEKVYYLPYLIGERSPINDPYIRGAFLGLALHHDKATMSRAVMEGVAFSVRQMYEEMKITGTPNFKITGGGAKNKLWVEIIANSLGHPITMINSSEGPALGAAMLALAGATGSSIAEISKQSVDVIDVIKPTSEQQVYEQKYQTWKTIYPAIKGLEL